MIHLTTRIMISPTETSEKNKLQVNSWYKVIGSYEREYTKDGKKEKQDMFMVLNTDGSIVNMFPSKCKVVIDSMPKV